MWRRCQILLFATVFLIACGGVSSAQEKLKASSHQFQKNIYDQIGSVWYSSMVANSQKVPVGVARVAFTILPDGQITNLRVLSNTSNELFAKICLRAIQKVKIPPVPAELLTHGKFEEEITFKDFPN
jgi:TonB family protein